MKKLIEIASLMVATMVATYLPRTLSWATGCTLEEIAAGNYENNERLISLGW